MTKKWLNIPHIIRDISKTPWYQDTSDYNTNAKTYYDYLAKWNKHILLMTDYVNRLMRRNILFNDSNTIDFTKVGDWISNGTCNGWDDIIKINAVVKIALEHTETIKSTINQQLYMVRNSIKEVDGGLFSPDYINFLRHLEMNIIEILEKITDIYSKISTLESKVETLINDINNIKSDIDNIKTQITNINDAINNINQTLSQINQAINSINQTLNNHNTRLNDYGQRIITLEEQNNILRNSLQKILNNLLNGGAITTNNLETYSFVDNRTIASGNINIFGGSADGSSFIRTNNGQTENDLVGGI